MSFNKAHEDFIGIYYFVVVTTILTILKLVDAISWSWWFITLPLWAPVVMFAEYILYRLVMKVFE